MTLRPQASEFKRFYKKWLTFPYLRIQIELQSELANIQYWFLAIVCCQAPDCYYQRIAIKTSAQPR